MIISSRLCCKHRNNALSSRLFRLHNCKSSYIRCLHKQSRFKTPLSTTHFEPTNADIDSNPPSTFFTNKHETVQGINTFPIRRSDSDEFSHLQDSIISKLDSLNWNLNAKRYSSLFKNNQSYEPVLSSSDKHILNISKLKTYSNNYISPESFRSELIRQKFSNDPTLKYQYKLVNNIESLEEINCLILFVQRLTSRTYVNSKLSIHRFLKQRLIYDENMHPLLIRHKIISYMLIDYFLSSQSISNLHTANYIVSLIGGWDTNILNIFLKNASLLKVNEVQKLKAIDTVLELFQSNNLSLDINSFSFLYQSTSPLKSNHNDFKLKKYLLSMLFSQSTGRKLLDQKTTLLLFKDIRHSLKITNEIHASNPEFAQKIIDDIMETMNQIPLSDPKVKISAPTFKTVRKNISILKDLRKIYAHCKFKTVPIFSELISTLLDELQWQRSWKTVISNYSYLNMKGDHISKNRKAFQFLKYSAFGHIFNMNKDKFLQHLNRDFAPQLLNHQANISNWQLHLRALNEIELINKREGRNNDSLALTYKSSLKKLTNLNLNESHIDKTSFLILSKILLHRCLSTKAGSFMYLYDLVYNLQRKIDKLYHSNYVESETYTQLLKNKILSSREEYLSSEKFIDYVSLLSRESNTAPPESLVFYEENYNNTWDNQSTERTIINAKVDDVGPLSSNLLEITPFEKLLFEKISQLYVLDTIDKVELEYSEYEQYWTNAGISKHDVLKNHHLGFINQSYLTSELCWETWEEYLSGKNLSRGLNGNSFENVPPLNEYVSNKIDKISQTAEVDLDGIIVSKKDQKLKNVFKGRSKVDGSWKPLNETSSINNVLPNDWLRFCVDKTLKDWIMERLAEK